MHVHPLLVSRAKRRPAMSNEALLTAAVLATLAASSPSQQQFSELAKQRMPVHNSLTTAIELGDLDGDGDLDMIVAKRGQTNLYLNRAINTGTFAATAGRLPAQGGFTEDVVLGDVDADGDLDIVLANYGQNWLYLNDGNGNFTDVTLTQMPVDTDNTVGLALGDVDGDGDLDLVTANGAYSQPRRDRLYLNDGSGNFSDVTAQKMPPGLGSTAVALGDIEGDGDLDMILGKVSTPTYLYLNTGGGTFVDEPGRLPAYPDNTNDLVFGDVDDDGDLDIVIGNGTFAMFWPATQRLYVNGGNGFFTETPLPFLNDAYADAVVLGDVDGDGDLDMIFANYGNIPYMSQPNQLLINNGELGFGDATVQRMPSGLDESHAAALGDVDGDGDLDLVVGNSRQDRLYLNLLNQLDTPLYPQIGEPYRFDAYIRYGQASEQDVAFLFLSGGTASIPFPPLGTVGLDPTQLLAVPPFGVAQPVGTGSITLPVPNTPAAVGVSVHGQAVLLPQLFPQQARLSNVTSDVIE